MSVQTVYPPQSTPSGQFSAPRVSISIKVKNLGTAKSITSTKNISVA